MSVNFSDDAVLTPTTPVVYEKQPGVPKFECFEYLPKTRDYVVLIPIINEGDRIAAKKGQIQLLYFVNAVIDEVVESGQYMEWYREADAYAQSLGLE